MPQNLFGTALIGRDDAPTRLAGVLGRPPCPEARAVLIAGDARGVHDVGTVGDRTRLHRQG